MSATSDEAAVRQAFDRLIKALLSADKGALEAGVADQLSFVHADGHVQRKADFVAVIANKKAIYRSATVSEPTITVIGDAAMIRYTGEFQVEAGGRAFTLKLVVLHVWVKDGGTWKLLAHQGTKLPA
jgi:hypothetical protein